MLIESWFDWVRLNQCITWKLVLYCLILKFHVSFKSSSSLSLEISSSTIGHLNIWFLRAGIFLIFFVLIYISMIRVTGLLLVFVIQFVEFVNFEVKGAPKIKKCEIKFLSIFKRKSWEDFLLNQWFGLEACPWHFKLGCVYA